MANRADYFDLIRQLVRGDYEGYTLRCNDLDEKGWEGLGLVVGAAFYKATRKQLGNSYDSAKIIRFVADFRSEITAFGADVEPIVAERLIQAATTNSTNLVDDLDPAVVVEAEMLMLWKLLGPLSDTDLTLFFTEVDALADRWSQ